MYKDSEFHKFSTVESWLTGSPMPSSANEIKLDVIFKFLEMLVLAQLRRGICFAGVILITEMYWRYFPSKVN